MNVEEDRTFVRATHGIAAAVVIFAWLLLPGSAVHGQSPPPDHVSAVSEHRPVLHATRRGGRIAVDGRLEEEVWETAPVASRFVQRGPNPGARASEATGVRVVYGEDAVFVGARLSADPDSISMQLARRDTRDVFSDWFSVLLDSDDDNRTAFAFEANPRGLERDYILRESGRRDFSWNAVWDVETHIGKSGWTAEFRIPLSQLRYDEAETSWGVNFRRETARREEVDFWADIPPDATGFVSRFGSLRGLSGLESPNRLEISPYSVSRLVRSPSVDPEDPFRSANDLTADAGLDLKYGVTGDLTLTATFNPDFGQVEADPSQVNLTEFETFFSENRPFFLEGADLFDVNMLWGSRLFYSRRIGRAPQGRVPDDATFRKIPSRTTILGAAKLSGKTVDGWSIGFLDAVTAREEARYSSRTGEQLETVRVEPLTNYNVARVSKDFQDGNSAIGGIFTTTNRRRIGGENLGFLRSGAYTGGMDFRHRVGDGRYEVSGVAVGSHVEGSRRAISRTQREPERYFQRPGTGHLTFDSTRTALSGVNTHVRFRKRGGHWRGSLMVGAVSPGFEIDDVGYQRVADRANVGGNFGYTQFEPGRVLRRWRVSVGSGLASTFGGEAVVRSVWGSANVQLRNLWSGSFHLRRMGESFSMTALRGGPGIVEPARTRFHAMMASDSRETLHGTLSVNGTLEDETDGWSLGIAPGVELRPSSRLQLSLDTRIAWHHEVWQYVDRTSVGSGTRHIFAGLDRATTSLTGRMSYALTPDLSLEYYGQPFLSTGDYSGFMQVRDPAASTFGERFLSLPDAHLSFDGEADRYRWDPDGDGAPDAGWGNPDFNVAQFRSNFVLRWEYRPGSTLFLAWNLERTDSLRDPSYDLKRAVDRLAGARGPGVFLLKASYWFGL